MQLLGGSAAKGAQTSVFLASSPGLEKVTGQYFVRNKPVRLLPKARDKIAAKRLWDLSAQLTGTPGN